MGSELDNKNSGFDYKSEEFDTFLKGKFEEFQTSFKEEINKSLNGLSKKITSQIKAIADLKTPQKDTSTEETQEENNETNFVTETDAIAQIRADYERQLKTIQKQSEKTNADFEAYKKFQEEKQRRLFINSLKASALSQLSEKGIDDPQTALTVFLSLHPDSNFTEDESGVILYSSDDGNQTLNETVTGFIDSPVGKRFKSASQTLPNGSGSDGQTKKQLPSTEPQKANSTQEMLKQIQSGQAKISF